MFFFHSEIFLQNVINLLVRRYHFRVKLDKFRFWSTIWIIKQLLRVVPITNSYNLPSENSHWLLAPRIGSLRREDQLSWCVVEILRVVPNRGGGHVYVISSCSSPHLSLIPHSPHNLHRFRLRHYLFMPDVISVSGLLTGSYVWEVGWFERPTLTRKRNAPGYVW